MIEAGGTLSVPDDDFAPIQGFLIATLSQGSFTPLVWREIGHHEPLEFQDGTVEFAPAA